MILQSLTDLIKRLFKVKPLVTNTRQTENDTYERQYADIHDINLTAWVAGKVAKQVVSDCTISVTGKSARAELLDMAIQKYVSRLGKAVTRALAVGGVVLKPYVSGGRLCVDILPQSRLLIIAQAGDMITAAAFLSECFVDGDTAYTLTEYHRLDGGEYTITWRAAKNGAEVPLGSVPRWAGISPQMTITNVTQMLYGFIACPIDGRGDMNDAYGVPVTYGQAKLVKEIVELLNMFQREFRLKEAFVGVSDLLFDGKEKLPASGVYRKLRTDDANFFETYSPDIRAEAYIDGVNYKLGLLEKAIGVNKGILTDMETADATSTAIKRSTFDTWTLIDDMRTNVETGTAQLAYALDVYANAMGLTEQGEYDIAYDWDYSLLEDSAERHQQLQEGTAAGYVAPWETRAWVMNETPEQAKRNMPKMEALLVGE